MKLFEISQGFYTTWLILPSIVGIFVFIYGWATLPFDIPTWVPPHLIWVEASSYYIWLSILNLYFKKRDMQLKCDHVSNLRELQLWALEAQRQLHLLQSNHRGAIFFIPILIPQEWPFFSWHNRLLTQSIIRGRYFFPSLWRYGQSSSSSSGRENSQDFNFNGTLSTTKKISKAYVQNMKLKSQNSKPSVRTP